MPAPAFRTFHRGAERRGLILAVHALKLMSAIIADKFSHSSKHSFSVLDLFSAAKVSISFELYKFIMVQ